MVRNKNTLLKEKIFKINCRECLSEFDPKDSKEAKGKL